MVDINTLVVCEAVVSLGVWLMFVFYRQTQKTYQGFSLWETASLAILLAYVAMSARGVPGLVSDIRVSFALQFIQNFMLVLAVVMRLDGTFRFLLEKRLWRSFYLLPVIIMAVMSYYQIVVDNIALRSLIFSIIMFSVFALTSVVFFMRSDKSSKLYILVGLINIIWGFVIMLRAVSWIYAPHYKIFDPFLFNTLLFASTPLFNIGLGISLLLVNSQRTQDELKESEDKFATVFRSSPHAVMLTDFYDGRILDANEGFMRMTGYVREEIVGKTTLDLRLWVNRNDRAVILGDLLENADVRGKELQFYSKNGEIVTGLFSAGIVKINNRKNILSSIEDITEIKRVQEERERFNVQLQHSQKLESIGVLAGGIAHDLNNILMVILGNTELGFKDIDDTSPARKRLENINKATVKAAGICRQMLAYSGKGLFVIKPVDLSKMVKEMASMLDVSISKKVVLNYNLANELPMIEVDAVQIQQIIMNLVINASEAIGDRSGVINLSTGVLECDEEFIDNNRLRDVISKGYYVYLEVEDNGCGMDHETMAKIFDPFFTTKYTGRGLGLSAVKGIIKNHRGGMTILTEPGKGTVFKVLFPMPVEPANEIAEEEIGQDVTWKGSGTILLVDDEEPIIALNRQILEGMGFDVLVACDGSEALEIFRERMNEIVCVILDLTMPNMSGDETCREMKMLKPDVRVVISSGFSEQDVMHRFPENNLSGFIQKPYRMDSLAGVLRKVLDDGLCAA